MLSVRKRLLLLESDGHLGINGEAKSNVTCCHFILKVPHCIEKCKLADLLTSVNVSSCLGLTSFTKTLLNSFKTIASVSCRFF